MAIFVQINSIPGLNDPLETDHFSPHQHTSPPPNSKQDNRDLNKPVCHQLVKHSSEASLTCSIVASPALQADQKI